MNDADDIHGRGRRMGQRPRALRPPGICPLCRQQVIWAQMQAPKRQGKRPYVPVPIDRCPAGTGNIALSSALFAFGDASIAEKVANGTAYRLHRDHCPALKKSGASKTSTPAAAPRAFSAANFRSKKQAQQGGSK